MDLGGTIAQRDDEISELKAKLRIAEASMEDQHKSFEYLRERKRHYKGIVERVKLVLRSAWLLDVSEIKAEVLEDALQGDDPNVIPPDARRR